MFEYPFPAELQFSLSVQAVATDTVGPRLTSVPPNGQPTDGPLVLIFDEPVRLGTGTITLEAGTVSHTVRVDDPSRVSVSGNTLVFYPPVKLEFATFYSVSISAAAILDMAGNSAHEGKPFSVAFVSGLSPVALDLSGSTGPDTLHGSDLADKLDGRSGNDNIYGYGGDDILIGGDLATDPYDAGGDRLIGGDGNDTLYGGADTDSLNGENGDDRMFGGDDRDSLSGGYGNDYFDGGAGSDNLAGGPGLDTAVYGGRRDQYMLTELIMREVFITDLRPGANGDRDQVLTVERLYFSDGAIAYDTDASGVAGQAYRLYRAAFDREPDQAGLGFWIEMLDRGVSLQTAAGGFTQGEEFARLYGPNPSNAEIVTRLYRNILDREPDQGGYEFWLSVLDNKRADMGTVLAAFSESNENRAAVAGLIANGVDYQPFLG